MEQGQENTDTPENQVSAEQEWTTTIRPMYGWFDINLGEIWRYRDLILLFVKRDFVSVYKQTVLGPLWYLIQPLLTTLVFTIIFGQVAKISTDGLPQVLFYFTGFLAWRYFADSLNKTSNTFVTNAHIFGKVYFPRLTVPISVVVSNLIAFAIQVILLLCLWGYFYVKGADIHFQPLALLFLPLIVLQMAALGLGCGIIISSLTTKYRDFAQLVSFGVQLWMYATPVVYPLSILPEKWFWLMALNPMAPITEFFRYAFLGVGTVNATGMFISVLLTVLLLGLGIVLFSRIEKNFMDTV